MFNSSSLTERINAVVLFISTDYVFDGKNPPYNPDDIPNPLNKYGMSKFRGEEIVMEVNKGIFNICTCTCIQQLLLSIIIIC